MPKKSLFQKRHYCAIAKAIQDHFRWADAEIWADIFAADNPKFNRDRFIKAVYKLS